ncbi:hypothetical protein [Endozoicomonas ascidiicola]|uniref:hypothetical protein n=1 Tax=Endozoicomonas ascidiicola TaxID=1698521 RepID=UPI000830B32E|nr:hypothetical protein [Endozoicomonas ascidiicola]
MTFKSTHFFAVLFLLFSVNVKSDNTSITFSAQQLLHREIELSEVISHVYLLQLDFLDQDIREALQQAHQTLDNGIHALPQQIEDQSLNAQLKNIKSLWLTASNHLDWLSTLPSGSNSPNINTLMSFLVRMNHQFLIMRQRLTGGQPSYPFLEQALLIQQLTRDYLAMLVSEKKGENTDSSQLRINAMVKRFDRQLRAFEQALAQHTHAGQSIQEAQNTWQYIHNQFDATSYSPAPELIIRYSNRITGRLYSLHRMF